jgi:DNA-directed RNA polymerase subunit RPC12/RpoP
MAESATKAKLVPVAVTYTCAQCGRPLAAEPWMKPDQEYWCWPCAHGHLQAGFDAIKTEHQGRLQ